MTDEKTFDDLRGMSQSPHSKRLSGMYQAVPVFIDEPDQTGFFQNEVFVSQPKLVNLKSEKVSTERKEFLESMLKTSSTEVATGHQNGIEIKTSERVLQQKNEEDEKRLKQEMRKRAHEKHLEDQKIKEEVFSEKLKTEENEKEDSFSKDFTKQPQRAVSIGGQVDSAKSEIHFEKKSQVQKAEIKSVQEAIQTIEAKSNESVFPAKELIENASDARVRYCLAQTPTFRPKLYPFEAPQKESGFSISGMWSNVNLGLVKERSTFWQKCDRKNRRNLQNRKSRVIDPNEWVGHPTIASSDQSDFSEPSHLAEFRKNKFLSSGNLVADANAEAVVSSAMVAIEKRADGRKSADIFLPSNYGHKMSQVNKHREEKIQAAQKVDIETSKQDQNVLEEVLPAESCTDGSLPIEEVLKQELEKQKLIEQKLREIEEQNRILAELEAKETRLRKQEEERKRMFEESEMMKQKQRELLKKQETEAQFLVKQKQQEIEMQKKQETESQVFAKQQEIETQKKQEILQQSQVSKQIETESQILNEKETQETLQLQFSESQRSVHLEELKEEDKVNYQFQSSDVTKDHETDHAEQQRFKVEEKHPPQVPGRSSSKHVVRERSFAKMNSPQPFNSPQPLNSSQTMTSPQPFSSHIPISVSPAPSSSRLSSSPTLEMLGPNIVQVQY